jgi:hypothetical protein
VYLNIPEVIKHRVTNTGTPPFLDICIKTRYLELIADFDQFLAAGGRVGQIDFHFSHDPSRGKTRLSIHETKFFSLLQESL